MRVNLLIIDKDMNTVELDIPRFMLDEINYSQQQIKKHTTKKDLNNEVSEFLKKFVK